MPIPRNWVPLVDSDLNDKELMWCLGLLVSLFGKVERKLDSLLGRHKTHDSGENLVRGFAAFRNLSTEVDCFVDFYEELVPIRNGLVHGVVEINADRVDISHYASSQKGANKWGDAIPNPVVKASREHLKKMYQKYVDFPDIQEDIKTQLKNVRSVGLKQWFLIGPCFRHYVWRWQVLLAALDAYEHSWDDFSLAVALRPTAAEIRDRG